MISDVSREDLRKVSASILEIAWAGEVLARCAVGREPLPKSVAFAQEHSTDNFPTDAGGTHVRSAHTAILLLTLAAIDHLRTFAAATRNETMPSISLATLMRGAVEALARARWLLTAEDARQPSESLLRVCGYEVRRTVSRRR